VSFSGTGIDSRLSDTNNGANMSEFKVGDKAIFLGNHRYIADWPEDEAYAGQAGTVSEVTAAGTPRVTMPDGYLVKGWGEDQFELVPTAAYIINGANYEYPTLEAAEAGVKAIGNNGVTYQIAQIVKRVTVKRETVVTLEETV
jgi:hypothetical protein